MDTVRLRPGAPGEDGVQPSPGGFARNGQFDWDQFDPEKYVDHNYRELRADDRKIMNIVRDFFATVEIAPHRRAVDVGPGANLYPAMAMLPFCEHLDLWEFSAANVAWLNRQVAGYQEHWDSFWDVYRERAGYAGVTDPRALLSARAQVHQASIFDLPPRHWDLGTMFFVACSMSADLTEFRTAVHTFIAALRPGAPFAAAFMAKSRGYFVGDEFFPAVFIGAVEVEQALADVATGLRIHPIEVGDRLRDGYDGMIVATGRAA